MKINVIYKSFWCAILFVHFICFVIIVQSLFWDEALKQKLRHCDYCRICWTAKLWKDLVRHFLKHRRHHQQPVPAATLQQKFSCLDSSSAMEGWGGSLQLDFASKNWLGFRHWILPNHFNFDIARQWCGLTRDYLPKRLQLLLWSAIKKCVLRCCG